MEEFPIVTELKSRRSTLPKSKARERYVALGELVVLQQIQKDAARLDEQFMAVGPFARLDAGAVAALDGKTRGVISNAFGSQAVFQAETMALALGAASWIDLIVYPAPADFATEDAWLEAFFTGQSTRGPQHGAEPVVDYAALWVLWLSALPYGLWSQQICRPALEEHVLWVKSLEKILQQALDQFGKALRQGVTITDLASAVAHLVEGVWLNQCVTQNHPREPDVPIAAVMQRSGRMIWMGATELRPPAVRTRRSQR